MRVREPPRERGRYGPRSCWPTREFRNGRDPTAILPDRPARPARESVRVIAGLLVVDGDDHAKLAVGQRRGRHERVRRRRQAAEIEIRHGSRCRQTGKSREMHWRRRSGGFTGIAADDANTESFQISPPHVDGFVEGFRMRWPVVRIYTETRCHRDAGGAFPAAIPWTAAKNRRWFRAACPARNESVAARVEQPPFYEKRPRKRQNLDPGPEKGRRLPPCPAPTAPPVPAPASVSSRNVGSLEERIFAAARAVSS